MDEESGDENAKLQKQLMSRGPKTKKRRPKSELSDDEDFRPGEDYVGKAMAARKEREAKKKRNKEAAETLKKRKREKELDKVVEDANQEGGNKMELDEFIDKEDGGKKSATKKREIKRK